MRRFLVALLAAGLAAQASAEVVSVEIKVQRPWISGRAFKAGEYELLSGIVHYEVDPFAKSSQDITDIRLAPRNARGRVEFKGPFMVLRPLDPRRSNGGTIFEVANRGSTQMQGVLIEADTLALLANETREVSRPALFDMGYTVAWAGWQGNLKADEFGLDVPTAPVSGPVRGTTFLGYTSNGPDGGPLREVPACATNPADPAAVLRVNQSFDDPGTVVPRPEWRFSRREKGGAVVPDPSAVLLAKPLGKPALVSVSFQGGPPNVIRLGQAVVRDFVAHLRRPDKPSALNARPGDARRMIAYGYSQSARFLRDFIYRGFNADERGGPVFDGVLDTARREPDEAPSTTAMQCRGSAGNSVGSALRPVDLYPFADLPTPDLGRGRREGQLDQARRDKVQPRIFHILNSSEYWARAGSLLQTTTDGRRALPEASGTHIYAFSGTPHGPRRHTLFLEKATRADYPYNDNQDLSLAMPALLVLMDRWLAEGTVPPPSRAPVLRTTLVPPSELKFPRIPNVEVPQAPPSVWQMSLGPDYSTGGIIAEPPRLGPRYPLLVPQVDEDGNELGSWRGLATSVPLGTYTAWIYQDRRLLEGFGMLSGLQGAFIPFPTSKGQREKSGDPRQSVGERYGGIDGYMTAVESAIARQVSAGFLLPEERDRARSVMRNNWDRVSGLRLHWPRPAE
jgi:Alpha/beta hydrolase domain